MATEVWGHIDEAAFSTNDGGTNDADISGEIKFTGTATMIRL